MHITSKCAHHYAFYFKIEQGQERIFNFEQEPAHQEFLTTSSFQIFYSRFFELQFLSINMWDIKTNEINQLQPHLLLILRIEEEIWKDLWNAHLTKYLFFKLAKFGLSPFMKVVFICFNENSLKTKKNFLFHVKSSFRSWDVYIFILNIWLCRKTALLER